MAIGRRPLIFSKPSANADDEEGQEGVGEDALPDASEANPPFLMKTEIKEGAVPIVGWRYPNH